MLNVYLRYTPNSSSYFHRNGNTSITQSLIIAKAEVIEMLAEVGQSKRIKLRYSMAYCKNHKNKGNSHVYINIKDT